MTTSTTPTMPVPRALESLCGVAHPPDADVPEVPVRHVLAAIANAVGQTLESIESEQRSVALEVEESGTDAAVVLQGDLRSVRNAALNASRMLDDLVDRYDVAYPPPDDDIGAFP